MKKALYVSVCILMVGCSGRNKQTEAQFNRPKEDVIADLQQLHDFDAVEIKWTENRIDEGSSRGIYENIKWTANQIDKWVGHNLIVYLTNGVNLPEINASKAAIGNKAMQIVLNSIDNDTDYEDFTVVFVHEAVYGEMDMISENPFNYKLKDFRVNKD